MKQILLMLAGLKKKVSISVYLVSGGVGIIVLEIFVWGRTWVIFVGALALIAGTIWGFVDGMRTINYKRKSESDPTYAEQTEEPPPVGFMAFRIGLFCIVLCAIAFVIMLLLFAYVIGTMRH